MSDQITFEYAEKYQNGLDIVLQQMRSITEGTVTMAGDMMGAKRKRIGQIGAVRMQRKEGRFTDIPLVETPHMARWIYCENFAIREGIDEFDLLQTFNNPTNEYTQAFAAAAKRERDKITVDAVLGTNLTGEAGTTETALPSTQKILNGSTNFTFAKVREGVKMLRKKHALQLGDEIHCFYTSDEEESFINTTEVKSSDFNNRKVLVEAEVGIFYTVHFHRLEDLDDTAAGRMLPKSGNIRSCPMWAKSAVVYGERKAPKGRLVWIDEKEAWQVSIAMSAGATRKLEEGVVQIDVDVTA